jgi:hypothetical protein
LNATIPLGIMKYCFKIVKHSLVLHNLQYIRWYWKRFAPIEEERKDQTVLTIHHIGNFSVTNDRRVKTNSEIPDLLHGNRFSQLNNAFLCIKLEHEIRYFSDVTLKLPIWSSAIDLGVK